MPYCGRSGRLWRAFTARRRVAAAGAAAMLTAAVLVAPEIAAAASAAPALSFSPAPFNYGQVTVRQPASQTFSLANSGRPATGRLTVTLTGSAAFTITGNTCKSLAPGKTCRVTVRFTPVTSATVTATLTVAGKNTPPTPPTRSLAPERGLDRTSAASTGPTPRMARSTQPASAAAARSNLSRARTIRSGWP